MKKLLRLALLVGLVAIIPACAGATFSCTRHSDGSIECGVTTHADGNHDKPVPKEEAPK